MTTIHTINDLPTRFRNDDEAALIESAFGQAVEDGAISLEEIDSFESSNHTDFTADELKSINRIIKRHNYETFIVKSPKAALKAREDVSKKIESMGYTGIRKDNGHIVFRPKLEISHYPTIILDQDGMVYLKRTGVHISRPEDLKDIFRIIAILFNPLAPFQGLLIGKRKLDDLKGDVLDRIHDDIETWRQILSDDTVLSRSNNLASDLEIFWTGKDSSKRETSLTIFNELGLLPADIFLKPEEKRKIILDHWVSRIDTDDGTIMRDKIRDFIENIIMFSDYPCTTEEIETANAQREWGDVLEVSFADADTLNEKFKQGNSPVVAQRNVSLNSWQKAVEAELHAKYDASAKFYRQTADDDYFVAMLAKHLRVNPAEARGLVKFHAFQAEQKGKLEIQFNAAEEKFQLACQYLEVNDYHHAQKLFAQAAKQHPLLNGRYGANVTISLSLDGGVTVSHKGSGNLANELSALELLPEVAASKDNHIIAEIYRKWGTCLEASGHLEKAAQCYQMAIDFHKKAYFNNPDNKELISYLENIPNGKETMARWHAEWIPKNVSLETQDTPVKSRLTKKITAENQLIIAKNFLIAYHVNKYDKHALQSAIDYIKKSTLSDPVDSDKYYEDLWQGVWDIVLQLFGNGIAVDQRDYQEAIGLLLLYLSRRTGKNSAEINTTQDIGAALAQISITENDLKALEYLAYAFLRIGNAEASLGVYIVSLKYLQNDPEKMANTLKTMGRLFREVGDYAKSLQAYTTALELTQSNSEKASLHAGIASTYSTLDGGNYAKALEHINKAIVLEDAAYLHDIMGSIIKKMSQP